MTEGGCPMSKEYNSKDTFIKFNKWDVIWVTYRGHHLVNQNYESIPIGWNACGGWGHRINIMYKMYIDLVFCVSLYEAI